MQLSAKIQNAGLALLELARRHDNPAPVCLKTIADAQNISPPFLVQILLQLKRAGIVTSTRGACGGYRLALEPSQISLLDIVAAVEGAPPEKTCTGSTDPLAHTFFDAWNTLVEDHVRRMSEINLETLVAAAESPAGDMYYI